MTKINNIYVKLQKHISKHKNIYYSLALFITFIVLALHVYITPFNETDDYTYMNNFATGEPVTFSTLIESDNALYMHHGGRYVVTLFLQSAMILGKPYIAISESLIVILLAIMISKLASKNNHSNPIMVLLTLGLYYYCNCYWEENMLWVTGFWTYTFTALLYLLFLYFFTLDLRGFKTYKLFDNSIFFFILGLICSCNTEAHALAITLVCFFMLLYMKKINKLSTKHIAGWIGFAIGTLLLVIAPGNFARSGYVQTLLSDNVLYNYGIRFYNFFKNLFEYDYATIIILIIAILFTDKKKFNKSIAPWFITIGIFSMFAMLGSPVNAIRTFNPTMCIFFVSIIEALEYSSINKNKLNIISILIFIGFISVNGLYLLYDLIH